MKASTLPVPEEVLRRTLVDLVAFSADVRDAVGVSVNRADDGTFIIDTSDKVGALWLEGSESSLPVAVVVKPRIPEVVEVLILSLYRGSDLGRKVVLPDFAGAGSRPPLPVIWAFLRAVQILRRRLRSRPVEVIDEVVGSGKGRPLIKRYVSSYIHKRPWVVPVVSELKHPDHLANRVIKGALEASLKELRKWPHGGVDRAVVEGAEYLLNKLKYVSSGVPRGRDWHTLIKSVNKSLQVYKVPIELALAVLFPPNTYGDAFEKEAYRVYEDVRSFQGKVEGFNFIDLSSLFEKYLQALLGMHEGSGSRALALDVPQEATIFGRRIEVDVLPFRRGEWVFVLDAKYKPVFWGEENKGTAQIRFHQGALIIEITEGTRARIGLPQETSGFKPEIMHTNKVEANVSRSDIYQILAYATHRSVAEKAGEGGVKVLAGLVYPSPKIQVEGPCKGLGYRNPSDGGIPIYAFGLPVSEDMFKQDVVAEWLRLASPS